MVIKMSMAIPTEHETILLKYPKTCEKCNVAMTPLYVKVAHYHDADRYANTIHYVCDHCKAEYDMNVDIEGESNINIDPTRGVLL